MAEYYVDVGIGDFRFDDWGDLFFLALFYWWFWTVFQDVGVMFFTLFLLMRLRKE